MKLLALVVCTLLIAAAAAATTASEKKSWLEELFQEEEEKLIVDKKSAKPEASSCCAPDQWEGIVTTSSNAGRRPFFRLSYTSYDYKNQKVASKAKIYTKRTGKKPIQVRSIADFKAGKVYFIFNKKGKEVCHQVKLRASKKMRKPCVPKKFKMNKFHWGSGASGDNYKMRSYAYWSKEKRIGVSLVTTEKCTPVSMAVMGKRRRRRSGDEKKAGRGRSGEFFRVSSSFANISGGIKRKSVFKVPKACQKSPRASLELHRFQFKIPLDKHPMEHILASIKKFEPQIAKVASHAMPAQLHHDTNKFLEIFKKFQHL